MNRLNSSTGILKVALNLPLRQLFDYLPPDGCEENTIRTCQRVVVPFRNRQKVGLIVAISGTSKLTKQHLKKASSLLDQLPLFSQKHLDFLKWIANYYHHPLGEVVFASLSPLLRKATALQEVRALYWKHASHLSEKDLRNATPLKKKIMHYLENHPEGVMHDELARVFGRRYLIRTLSSLAKKQYIHQCTRDTDDDEEVFAIPGKAVTLTAAQGKAVHYIRQQPKNAIILLNGVTGSGKTEVYMHLIHEVVARGQQALLLLPEIALTPQIIVRLQQQFCCPLAILHSSATQRERLIAWQYAAQGIARIVLGTRSAVLVPLPQLALVIIDEEHDATYKQQDGLRYSARDVSIIKARYANCRVVLGSATPSLETLSNVHQGRYQQCLLPDRIGKAKPPDVSVLDIRGIKMHGAISEVLLDALKTCLAQQQQALLFLNRRGYAPVFLCHNCGSYFVCPNCDLSMTFHKSSNCLWCHHCNARHPPPTHCQKCHSDELLAVGYGTERLVDELQELLPNARIKGLDSDAARHADTLETTLAAVRAGTIDVLVGTQLLAKGHHFPKLTLVGIVNADQGLHHTDFRASERMGQLLFQLCGRAGRDKLQGKVVMQTHHPHHELLRAVVQNNYTLFAELLSQERQLAKLPPFSHLAVFIAEAYRSPMATEFLQSLQVLCRSSDANLVVHGPFPAPMERRANRYRMQLVLQSPKRKALWQILRDIVPKIVGLPATRRVRWTLDVDPMDML